MGGSESWKRHVAQAATDTQVLQSPGNGAMSPNLSGQTGQVGLGGSVIMPEPKSASWIPPAIAIAFLACGMSLMVAMLYPQWNDTRLQLQQQEIERLRDQIVAHDKAHAEQLRHAEDRMVLAEREARVCTERLADVRDVLSKMGYKTDGH